MLIQGVFTKLQVPWQALWTSSKLGSKDGLRQETSSSRCFLCMLTETTSEFPGFDLFRVCRKIIGRRELAFWDVEASPRNFLTHL